MVFKYIQGYTIHVGMFLIRIILTIVRFSAVAVCIHCRYYNVKLYYYYCYYYGVHEYYENDRPAAAAAAAAADR